MAKRPDRVGPHVVGEEEEEIGFGGIGSKCRQRSKKCN
jgi:hypothetical protein